jgi:hypothetical protein
MPGEGGVPLLAEAIIDSRVTTPVCASSEVGRGHCRGVGQTIRKVFGRNCLFPALLPPNPVPPAGWHRENFKFSRAGLFPST